MRRSSGDLYRDSYAGSPTARGKGLRVVLQTLGVLAGVMVIFGVGDYLQRYFGYRSGRELAKRYDPRAADVSLVEPLRSMVLNNVNLLLSPRAAEGLLESGLPVYDLRIAAKDLDELQTTAERVVARGISTGIERNYVPAEFLIDEGWEPIQVKLRGLYPQHYIKTRPSLRLKFPDRKLFHGAKQVNLLDPYDKAFTADVTTGWELERHGLLNWDSRFIVLRMNGDVVGLFLEIEQFGRSMTDRSLRPEGPIFSGFGEVFGKQGGGIYDKAMLPLQRIQGCHEVRDSRFPHAIPADSDSTRADCDWEFLQEYFQLDKWAWAAAMTQLLHSSHAWHPDNVRMFWDPARGQFEPIPWDYGLEDIDLALMPDGEQDLSGYARFLLAAPEFRRMRDVRAWSLLQERVEPMLDYADALFESISPALRHDTRHPSFALDEARQQEYVDLLRLNRDALVALYGRHELRVRSYAPSAGPIALVLENLGKSFLEVDGVTLRGDSGTRSLALDSPVLVDGIWQGAPGTTQLRVAAAPGEQLVALQVRDGVTGQRLARAEVSIEAASGAAPPQIPSPQVPPLRLDIENVRVTTSAVHFGPGRVEVSAPIELPSSLEVVFEAGLDLKMAPGAALMIYGDLTGLGSEARPIRISGSEPGRDWGGIFVQGTHLRKSRVRLQHTRISGGVGGENERTFFTSSFAVHDGIVELESCEFANGRADDGVNLKYAEVKLTGNSMRGSKDDSLDCDFCTGELRGNAIHDSGGDGFDFSGSDVLVTQNLVDRCADKGMSIGEKTVARVVDNEIRDCYTGIAVKDLSEVEIQDLILSRLQVGVAAYIKKPTFGPSRARLSGLQMTEVETDFVRDDACTLELVPQAIDRGPLEPGLVTR